MKFMLLIHQGTTPTPQDPEGWARLSQEEQRAVYADYTCGVAASRWRSGH